MSGKVTVPDIRGMYEENAKGCIEKKKTLEFRLLQEQSLRSIRPERPSKQTPEAGEKGIKIYRLKLLLVRDW